MKFRYILGVCMLSFLSAANSEQPQLEALEAYADETTSILTIIGRNFDNGSALEVTLAGRGLLVPVDPTAAQNATMIEVLLPDPLPPGTYTVFISSGGGLIRYDEIDFTWGAAGPTGADGQPGADGSSCSVGKVGDTATITCTDGTTANVIDGVDGLPGADGADGEDGAPGIQGPAGPNGLACWDLNGDGMPNLATEDLNADEFVDVNDCKGEQGTQGPPGPQGPEGPQGAEGPQGPQGEPGLKNELCYLYRLANYDPPSSLVSPESLLEITTCEDNIDNDCDGFVDVADTDCQLTEICNDGIDNDEDGLIDTADPDCPTPEMCADLIDNDFDGAVDCNDTDCDFAPECGFCSSNGPESNETMSSAYNLGTLSDGTADRVFISGNLHSDGDADWYRFTAQDDTQVIFDAFAPDIRFSSNPGNQFRLRVAKGTPQLFQLVCSELGGLGDGFCNNGGQNYWEEGTLGDDTATFYVEVVLGDGFGRTCDQYQLEVSNGFYHQ